MSKTRALTSEWNEWVVYSKQDPILRLMGVNETPDPEQVKAVFETASGLQVEGSVAQLRSLEYDLLYPYRRTKGQTEVYDYRRMREDEHDRWLQVSGGVDLIHDRMEYLREANALYRARLAIEKTMGIKLKPF